MCCDNHILSVICLQNSLRLASLWLSSIDCRTPFFNSQFLIYAGSLKCWRQCCIWLLSQTKHIVNDERPELIWFQNTSLSQTEKLLHDSISFFSYVSHPWTAIKKDKPLSPNLCWKLESDFSKCQLANTNGICKLIASYQCPQNTFSLAHQGF